MFRRPRSFSFTLLLSCLLFPLALIAQEPAHLHYTIDEGLPSNEVYDSYEDSLGYIWFATDHGISRFDGYSFRNYSTSDGLVHNTVFGFYKDRNGRVWMRTLNCSLCYMDKGAIRPYIYNEQLNKFLGRDFIQRFAFDKSGNLWFVSVRQSMGLFRQDIRTGKIEQIKFQRGFNGFIRELDNGELIYGMDLNNGYVPDEQSDDTLLHADHTWLFRMPKSKTGALDLSLILCLKRDASSFIFCYNTQLLVIEKGRISSRTTFTKLINNCYAEKSGQVWLCMNGFLRFIPGVGAGDGLLKDTYATSMVCDKVGNYWFTTLDNGVFFVRNMQLSALDHVSGNNFGELLHLGMCDNHVVALNGRGDIFRFRFSKMSGIDTSASDKWPVNYFGVNTFHCSPANNTIIFHNDLYAIDPKDFSWKYKRRCITNDYVNGIRGYAESDNSLFVAGNLGWFSADYNGNIIHDSRNEGFKAFCTAIANQPGKGTWIGTTDGLYIFTGEKTKKFEPENSAFRQRVTDIKTGKNGELFISTRGGGLIIMDGAERYYLHTSDGLSSDLCGNICVDDSVLWVCTNSGLNRIAMSRKKNGLAFSIRCINTQHGLPSNMVNDALCAGNFLFVATGKGIAWFDVRTFLFSSDPPPVYITSFLVNNHEADPSVDTLTWKDNNISIDFIGLLFRNPGTVHYRYHLDGYEQGWNYTRERMARYFNLPPGQYQFTVSAMNENGIWNNHPAMIRFYIPAHFTQTTWFRILIILLIAGVASGIVFMLVKQQRDRARSTLSLLLAEQKALRAQMKPHFIFNSLNSIQNFIIRSDTESAQIYLTSFSQLMRRVLGQSSLSSISLQEEIETLKLYLELEKLRFGKTFRYEIGVQDGIPASAIFIPPIFIQPYVENAIWHGLQLQKNSPVLSIHFTLEKNILTCVIEDNGIGRKKSREIQGNRHHASTGMKNVEERIALLNTTAREKISVQVIDLYDDGDKAKGTRIVLQFPVQQEK